MADLNYTDCKMNLLELFMKNFEKEIKDFKEYIKNNDKCSILF